MQTWDLCSLQFSWASLSLHPIHSHPLGILLRDVNDITSSCSVCHELDWDFARDMLLLGPLTGPLCCADGLCVMSSKSALKLLGLPNRGEALGLPAHKHVECLDYPGQRGIQLGTGTYCMT